MKRERWPVIDTHLHVGVNPTTTFIAEEELIPYLDENGIDIQIIFQVQGGFAHRTPKWNPYIGNDYIAKIQRMYPKRVIGLATINPHWQPPTVYELPYEKRGQKCDLIKHNEAIYELERAILDLGLNGIKLHPKSQNVTANSPTLIFPLMDKLTDLQEKTSRKMLVVVHGAGDSLLNAPESIADLAKNYPKLLFIMAHAGFIWGLGTVVDTIGQVSNIMLDLTVCTTKHVPIGFVEKYGVERVTAGTDGPHASYQIKMNIVNDMVSNDEEKELILGGNIAKLLNIQKVKD